ncbi:MAG: hypothetical protein ACFFD2_11660 [Promethearchaeota archaeon]
MREIDYHKRIWELQKKIFSCSCLNPNQSPTCYPDLHENVIKYKYSSDSIYIGKDYGKTKDFPRILFIGNNPYSKPNDFGTLYSVLKIYGNDLLSIRYKDFFKSYFNGIPGFKGVKQFTLFNDETWSISRIFKDIFSIDTNRIQPFSLTNGVLCMCRGARGAPTGRMRKNCIKKQGWLRKTLKILEPDIIFIFSIGEDNSTWSAFTKENMDIDKEIEFKPESKNAYKIRYKPEKRYMEHESLVFGIPHLTSTKKRFRT